MDDAAAAAVGAVLVPTQLERFRQLCEVDGPIEPRFDGYTKESFAGSPHARAMHTVDRCGGRVTP